MATPDYKAEKKDLDKRRSGNDKKWVAIEGVIKKGEAAANAFAEKLNADHTMVMGFQERADRLYDQWKPLAEEAIKLQAQLKKAKGNAGKEAELTGKIDDLHGQAGPIREEIQKNIERARAFLKEAEVRVKKMESLSKK